MQPKPSVQVPFGGGGEENNEEVETREVVPKEKEMEMSLNSNSLAEINTP